MIFSEERRELRLLGLLHVDDLVLCCEPEENLRAMRGSFSELCKRDMEVNADESKVVLGRG